MLKYLIQNRKTREYFQHGYWTLELRRAQEFSDVTQAMMACLRHNLDEVDLVFYFGRELGLDCALQLSLPARVTATVRAEC